MTLATDVTVAHAPTQIPYKLLQITHQPCITSPSIMLRARGRMIVIHQSESAQCAIHVVRAWYNLLKKIRALHFPSLIKCRSWQQQLLPKRTNGNYGTSRIAKRQPRLCKYDCVQWTIVFEIVCIIVNNLCWFVLIAYFNWWIERR